MTRPSRPSPIPSAARLVSTTRPTRAVDPIEVFTSAAPDAPRALWLRPSSGEALVGVGSAVDLAGTPDQISHVWRDLLRHAEMDGAFGPRLLGGFAFDPTAMASALWDGFGSSRLMLPATLLTLHGEAAWRTTNRVVDAPRSIPTRASSSPARTGLGLDDWQALVASVARDIAKSDGALRKVVLARAVQARIGVMLDVALRTLATDYPSCTIFAFSTPEATFLGATPERLVALRDGTATTMALAGSAPRATTPDEDQAIGQRLLSDPKERGEHAVVVQALRESLAPVATRVFADVAPSLRQLPNLQHLVTPVRAQIANGHGILDLVAHLHPTPAVGGYPRAQALELIREREALDRGWYAAPFGWVDADGEGEFVVGLRSALVRGRTATLFAGCGIVADSDPATELAESGWKLRPMLAALGVETQR